MRKQKYNTGNFNPIIGIIVAICILFVFFFIIKNRGFKNPSPQGYLAVNTEKVEYLPGENVTIQVSALGPDGRTLCSANLELEIGNVKSKNFVKASGCNADSFTSLPDYVFHYTPEKPGNYEIKLTNLDTKLTAKNKFRVVEKRDLDVKRIETSRINTEKETRYPVAFSVKAANDYKGEFSDTIPEGFTFAWWGPAKISDNSDGSKKISWKLDLKAGETAEFAYEFVAPKDAPLLYKFGANSEWQVVSAK